MRYIDLVPKGQEVLIKHKDEPDSILVAENFDEAFKHLQMCRALGIEVESISHDSVRSFHELKLKSNEEELIPT